MRVLFVIILMIIFLRTKRSFADAPSSIELAFSVKFDNTKYASLKNYWLAVSKMETNNFTSNLFVNHNNLFGFKYFEGLVLQKPIENSEFAHYDSKYDSLDDLLKYLERKKYPTSFNSLKEMINFMSGVGYFGSESVASYYQKVLNINKQFSKETQDLKQVAKNEVTNYLNSIMINSGVQDIWDKKLNNL